MNYWVYENRKRSGYATIHREHCRFCEKGTGVSWSMRWYWDRWNGPYSSREEAISFARRDGRREAKNCGHCGGAR